MLLALFGIDDGGLNLAVNLLVLFLIVLWISLVAWTYLDARRRIQDRFLVTCATIGSLFPFVGAIVYAILRPPEFLEDAHERELEIRAAELRVRQLTEQSCPSCEFPIERSYLRCPSCRARLKDPCPSCAKPLDPRWSVCPYCELPIQRRRRPAQRRPQEEGRGSEPRTRAAGSERGEQRRPAARTKRTAAAAESSEAAPPRSAKATGRRAKRKTAPEADGAPAAPAAESPPTEETPVAGKPSRKSESRPAPTP